MTAVGGRRANGSREALRWLGSIGVFYVAGPLWIVLTEPVAARLLPFSAPHLAPWLVGLGWLLVVAGGLLAASCMAALLRRGRGHPFDLTGKGALSRPTTRLVRDGAYAWSRNPMGLGDTLLYAGVALATSSLHSLVLNVPLWMAVVCWNHRVNERPSLVERFGEDFLQYEREVACLVPGPRTLAARWRALVGASA